jgi:hypothetical protein
MSERQKRWAREARKALFAKLGESCVVCGSTERLTFDCIAPCGHKHHRVDQSARTSFYRREFERGNLQVLCDRCNSRKGDDDMEIAFGLRFAFMSCPTPSETAPW